MDRKVNGLLHEERNLRQSARYEPQVSETGMTDNGFAQGLEKLSSDSGMRCVQNGDAQC